MSCKVAQLTLEPPSTRPRLVFSIPIKTTNPSNQSRGNSRTIAIIRSQEDAKRREAGRTHTNMALAASGLSRVDFLPAIVTMIRVSAAKMDDDGVYGALKRIRDGIAIALGVNDGGPFISFRYGQRRGSAKHFAVDVRIERAP